MRCVSAQEAAQEMASNKGILLDVREPSEVSEKPVEASINIPRGVLEMKMLEKTKDSSTPIYVHCASGVRAKLSGEQLMLMGYDNVSVITCPVDDIVNATKD
nr:rhodanese-like domain-containing protein [Alteromonas profundi]